MGVFGSYSFDRFKFEAGEEIRTLDFNIGKVIR